MQVHKTGNVKDFVRKNGGKIEKWNRQEIYMLDLIWEMKIHR